jgi:hypothetical protein
MSRKSTSEMCFNSICGVWREIVWPFICAVSAGIKGIQVNIFADIMPQLAPAQMAWVTIWRKKYRLSSDDIAKKLHKMGYDVDPISLEEYFQNKGMLPDPDEPGAVPPPQAPLGQFITAMERDIETVLLSQLGSLGLTLYVAENGRNGQQYPAGEFGRIDLLTLDSNKDFVVIELKRDDAPRAVIGQIAGYIAFVKKTLATPKGQFCRRLDCGASLLTSR